MTTDSPVLSHVQAGVAWITLNRVAQHNALDIPTLKHCMPCSIRSIPTPLCVRWC